MRTSEESPAVDVLKHLSDSLRSQWRRYRKRLKRCQERFSEEAVHDSRVETRRLLSTIELLGAFLPQRDLRKTRRALKRHLDTFDQLRDTQVQLVYVGRMVPAFSAARALRDWLQKREARFTRKTREAVKRIKTRRLGRRLALLGGGIRDARKHLPGDRGFAALLRAMDRAFGRVAQLCRHVAAEDTETIHRTRIAFKRFRYMVEALSPLLPVVTEEHRRMMRGYQSMMGDIQDMEVLLAAFEKFARKRDLDPAETRQLRDELLRRRRWLVRVYLNAAGRLRQFWPLPGLRLPAQTRKPKLP